MTRDSQWPARLVDALKRYEGAPHEWGAADGLQFARDCVRAVAGVDLLPAGFGAYSSRLTLKIRLRRHGAANVDALLSAAAARHGFREIPPRYAIEGDLGVTADGTAAIRFAHGFVARDDAGRFVAVQPSRVWRID